MDTWATSSVTPLLNTHLMIQRDADGNVIATDRHDRIFPYDLRPQAHDIIRTWAFYTIAKSYYHFGEIPWKDIVISGHAQDSSKKKISKSKGHVVTPAEMVEKYTADNLRYWSSSCKLGTDTIYDEQNLTEGKKLITKLFNATKFALRHLIDFVPPMVAATSVAENGNSAEVADVQGSQQDGPARSAAPTRDGDSKGPATKVAATEDLRPAAEAAATGQRYDIDALCAMVTYPTDRWMLKRCQLAEEQATKANLDYEFGDAKQAAEDFFWADFCDDYLELSKGRLYSDSLAVEAHGKHDAAELRLSAQAALFLGLSSVLKLFAPILPHITEECWSWYFAQYSDKRSIHEEPWPTYERAIADERDVFAGELLAQVIALVRKWKSEHNVSLKAPVARVTLFVGGDTETAAVGDAIRDIMGDLLSVGNARICSINGGAVPDDATRIEGNPYAVTLELAEER